MILIASAPTVPMVFAVTLPALALVNPALFPVTEELAALSSMPLMIPVLAIENVIILALVVVHPTILALLASHVYVMAMAPVVMA